MKIAKKKSVLLTIVRGVLPGLIGILVVWVLTQGAYLVGRGILWLFEEECKSISSVYGYGILCICTLVIAGGVICTGITFFIQYCKMCSKFAKLPLTQQEFDAGTKDLDIQECLAFFLDMISFKYNGRRYFYRHFYYSEHRCDEMIKCGEMMLVKYGKPIVLFTNEDDDMEFWDTVHMLTMYMGIENHDRITGEVEKNYCCCVHSDIKSDSADENNLSCSVKEDKQR